MDAKEDYLDVNAELYRAFTRDDQYGTLGRKRQPWQENLRLIICAITLVPLRFLGCLYFVTAFYLVCRFVSLQSSDRLFVLSYISGSITAHNHQPVEMLLSFCFIGEMSYLQRD